MSEKPLFIKELIRQVHDELIQSQIAREDKGLPSLFEVDKLTIEANFIVTDDQEAEAGFGFQLLKASAKVNYKNEQVHKVTLELNTKQQIKESESKPTSKSGSGGGGYSFPDGANPAPIT